VFIAESSREDRREKPRRIQINASGNRLKILILQTLPADIGAVNRTAVMQDMKTKSMPAHDLVAVWEEHLWQKFAARNPDGQTHTMVADPDLNHVPTMTGGVGFDEVKRARAVTLTRDASSVRPERRQPVRRVEQDR
jgi:hypothetical protein